MNGDAEPVFTATVRAAGIDGDGLSVETLFAEIDKALADGWRFRAFQYDPDFGHPTAVHMVGDGADAEFILDVVAFEVLTDDRSPDTPGAEPATPEPTAQGPGAAELDAAGPLVLVDEGQSVRPGGRVVVDVAARVVHSPSWTFERADTNGAWSLTHTLKADSEQVRAIEPGTLQTTSDGPALIGPATVTLPIPEDTPPGSARICTNRYGACIQFEIG